MDDFPLLVYIFHPWPDRRGKSFVACALAQKAYRDGYAPLYTRAQSLFRDLAMARADRCSTLADALGPLNTSRLINVIRRLALHRSD
jgi:hypothetical protein